MLSGLKYMYTRTSSHSAILFATLMSFLRLGTESKLSLLSLL